MTSKPHSSRQSLLTRIAALVRAIEESDESKIEEAVLRPFEGAVEVAKPERGVDGQAGAKGAQI